MGKNIHIYPSVFSNESRIVRETIALEKMGIFSDIVLLGVKGNDLPENEKLSRSVDIKRLSPGKSGFGSLGKAVSFFLWCVNVVVYSVRNNVVCVNCHSLPVLPLCVFIKVLTGAKLIYDAHELETEVNYLGGFRKKLSKIVERTLIPFADYSIFVGVCIENWYKETYALKNTDVIYNCPDAMEYENSNYFRKKYQISDDVKVFLYQGILSKGRGIESVISAFSNLTDAVVVFMGYGPLENYIKDFAGSGKVFYHDAVAPDELLRYTASTDFGLSIIEPVSISYEYCMPNKLFEYVMSNKPVVVSPTLEQKKFVNDMQVGIVAEDCSPESVETAVRDIMAMEYTQLIEATQNARSSFNWQSQEKLLHSIFVDKLGFSSTY